MNCTTVDYYRNELNRLNLQRVRLEQCNWSFEDKQKTLEAYNTLESVYTKQLQNAQEKINEIEVPAYHILESGIN